MKIKLLICLLVFLFALPVMAAPRYDSDGGRSATRASQTIDNTTYIDINKVFMFVTNHGNFGRDLADFFGNDYGTYFPFTSLEDVFSGANVTSPNYASGLWVGATDAATGDTLIIISEYSDEYVPGPMSGGTFMPDAPEFRVYKLWADSIDWAREDAANVYAEMEAYMSEAVPNQGAPWRVDTLYDNEDTALVVSIDTIPDIIGDQMLWAVYNDADPAQHQNDAGLTDPLGLEVKQTTFAFNRENPLGNIIFMRHRVFNKGGKTLENCYFSLWADPDLGGAGDDLVGCDIDLSLGFVYNDNNSDQYYGSTPPAMGFDFFQGPLVARTAETASLPDGKAWGQTYADSVNLGMVSFNKYINGTDPDNYQETYGFMNGLTKQGTDYVNPITGEVSKYVHTGDPVTGEGDLDIAPADRRWMQSTGPVTFAPGDSTEILAAMIVGRGGDRLSSISVLKYYDQFAQTAYDIDFKIPEPPDAPVVHTSERPGQLTLIWGTDSEDDPGDYPFQGYTVFQGETSAGPWTRIANYDVVDGIAQILDDVLDPFTGALETRAVKIGNDGGITRYFIVDRDYLLGGDLSDASTYYFRVEAYSYDPAATPKTLTSATPALALTPQAPAAGTHLTISAMDTLEVAHPSGVSDGIVYPLVLDPLALTGDSYSITFNEDTVEQFTPAQDIDWYTVFETVDTCDVEWDTDGDSLIVYLCVDSTLDSSTVEPAHYDTVVNTLWNLNNTSTGQTLLADQSNLSLDDTYTTVDGMMVKVSGPPLEGKDWDYGSAEPANLSPVATAADPEYTGGRWFTGGNHGGELFFGGMFMEPNFWGLTSVQPAEYPTIEIRFRPMASYTDLNGDGEYSIGEPYVVDDPAETQSAFMYTGFSGATYEGFFPVPFTAWDVTDPANPRQVNIVMRDRDGNQQWDMHTQEDPADPLLPNGGDQRFNYVWFTVTDYDATGTYYGDGSGSTVDFWSYEGGDGVWDAAWTMWVNDRGNGGMLAEECTFTLIPNIVNTINDVFTFSAAAPTFTSTESDLDAIRAVPNPFYLYSGYDPSPGNKQVKWHHLPAKCTITIYNLGGELIETIEKDDASTAIASWDLLTFNGLPVASGIYIYVVDAPGFGQKIGKMAIFTEEEVLRIY